MTSNAVLLAAGRGTRLRPHTDTIPKPLLVHRGKPTLDYLMDSLLDAGIYNIVLVTHHLAPQLEQYANARSAYSGQIVQCVYQQQLFGTAHALQTVIESMPEFVEESFLLSATDYIVPKNFFPDLVAFHQANSHDLSVSMKLLPTHELQARSSVRFKEDQSIAEIVEKPQAGLAPSQLGANLAFILPPDLVPYLDDVPVSQRGEAEIQYAINQWIASGGLALGLEQPLPAEWCLENA